VSAVTLAVALLLFCATDAAGQTSSAPAWSVSIAANTYFLADESNYVQPGVTADRDWLHLEARYNYEALDTGSLWFGYNFSGGETLAWELTPMLAGVFGDTQALAAGYRGTLSWRRLDVYSESEYVFDTGDSSDSFFYNWSEVGILPLEWLRCGAVIQRTRVYQIERDVQRGLFAGITLERFDLTTYVLNPDNEATVVFSVVVRF
jgi:hypothetical protein